MKSNIASTRVLLICLSLVFLFSFQAQAEPDQAQDQFFGDGQSFQSSDALRYGGLFGPIPAPESFVTVTYLDREPALAPPDSQPPSVPDSRDLGFGAGVGGFEALNRPLCDDPLLCP